MVVVVVVVVVVAVMALHRTETRVNLSRGHIEAPGYKRDLILVEAADSDSGFTARHQVRVGRLMIAARAWQMSSPVCNETQEAAGNR